MQQSDVQKRRPDTSVVGARRTPHGMTAAKTTSKRVITGIREREAMTHRPISHYPLDPPSPKKLLVW
jgi:hypothetical protein